MAQIEDQKMKLANKMAAGSMVGTGVVNASGGPLGASSAGPANPSASQGPSPTRIQQGAFRNDFSQASADHMRGVDLNQYGYQGGANGAFDQGSYDNAYNNWLYNSNDVLANAMTTSGQKLSYNLDNEAKKFGQEAGGMKSESANLLSRQADQVAGQAVRGVRKADNSRGLLYSNIREGNEAGAKGRVSSLLAQQIADSNSDIDKSLLTRQQSAAQAKLNQADQAVQRQAEVDSVRQANSVSRMQQMQQLAQMAGYAGGQMASDYRGGSSPSSNGQRTSTGGNRYMSSEAY